MWWSYHFYFTFRGFFKGRLCRCRISVKGIVCRAWVARIARIRCACTGYVYICVCVCILYIQTHWPVWEKRPSIWLGYLGCLVYLISNTVSRYYVIKCRSLCSYSWGLWIKSKSSYPRNYLGSYLKQYHHNLNPDPINYRHSYTRFRYVQRSRNLNKEGKK